MRRDHYFTDANAFVRSGEGRADAAPPLSRGVASGEAPVPVPGASHFVSTLPERPDAMRLEAVARSLRQRAERMGPELGEAHLSRALAEIADAVAFLLRGGKS